MGRVIRTSETVITSSTVAPLDLYFVKKHIKSISDSEDELIESWILAAATHFEAATGRQLTTAVREYWLDEWPTGNCEIELPRPPLQAVESVSYLDAAGDLITFDDGGSPAIESFDVQVRAGAFARPGSIVPLSGGYWPTISVCRPGAVRIRFTCGYGDGPDDIPDLVKTVLCCLVGQFDQFRSETYASARSVSLDRLPLGIDLLMDEFKSSALRTSVPSRWLS